MKKLMILVAVVLLLSVTGVAWSDDTLPVVTDPTSALLISLVKALGLPGALLVLGVGALMKLKLPTSLPLSVVMNAEPIKIQIVPVEPLQIKVLPTVDTDPTQLLIRELLRRLPVQEPRRDDPGEGKPQ